MREIAMCDVLQARDTQGLAQTIGITGADVASIAAGVLNQRPSERPTAPNARAWKRWISGTGR